MVLGAGIEELCFALPRDVYAGFLVHFAVILTWLSLHLSFSSFPSPLTLTLSIISSSFAHSYPLPSPSASPSALRRHASTADSRRTLTRIAFAVTHAKAASDPSRLSPSTLDADEQPSSPFDPFDLSIARYPPTANPSPPTLAVSTSSPHTVLPAYLQSACPRQPHNGSHQRRSPIRILLRLAP
jgi:hypothetical protein